MLFERQKFSLVVKKALREACASLYVVSTRKNGLGFILKLADPSRSYKIWYLLTLKLINVLVPNVSIVTVSIS